MDTQAALQPYNANYGQYKQSSSTVAPMTPSFGTSQNSYADQSNARNPRYAGTQPTSQAQYDPRNQMGSKLDSSLPKL